MISSPDPYFDDLSDQDLELIRTALERHLDRQDADTAQTLQALDKLFPSDDYWTDQDAQHFGENVADTAPGAPGGDGQ